MNIKGQGHLLTVLQCHSDPTFSNFISIETARQIEAKFHVEPPWDGGVKAITNSLCHITKMAAMPIFFSGTKRLMTLKLGLRHWLLEYYQVCSNDDPGLTLTYFTARSNLVLFVIVWENFQKTIEACEVKVGIYR